MSVIAAVRKGNTIAVAADSQSNFGDLRPPPANHEVLKLREVGGAILAASGWALYDDLLAHYLRRKSRSPRVLTDRASIFEFFLGFWKAIRKDGCFVNDQSRTDDKSPFADLDATFLAATSHGIFLVSSNMSVSEFRQFYAIGSGGDFAIGALHALSATAGEQMSAEEMATAAVGAAIAYDSCCGGSIVVRTVKTRPLPPVGPASRKSRPVSKPAVS
jgi:ATP-dependent protease HslVU (ClpYQ) peptidase subunit